jgi:bifunctional non-homologous end joining protein LigD
MMGSSASHLAPYHLREAAKSIQPGLSVPDPHTDPVASSLPRVAPIVPVLRQQPFNDSTWLFEPKYDGFRGMLYLARSGCALYSKRGNRMTRFQELAEQVRAELGRREVILDGEIVALDDEGRINFWALMRGQGTLAYAAFDLLWLNGRDLRGLPLARRKKHLERLVPISVGTLNQVPCFEGEGLELFQAACRLELEGIVAKRKTDPYRPEIQWCKIKNPAYTQAEGRGEFFDRR